MIIGARSRSRRKGLEITGPLAAAGVRGEQWGKCFPANGEDMAFVPLPVRGSAPAGRSPEGSGLCAGGSRNVGNPKGAGDRAGDRQTVGLGCDLTARELGACRLRDNRAHRDLSDAGTIDRCFDRGWAKRCAPGFLMSRRLLHLCALCARMNACFCSSGGRTDE